MPNDSANIVRSPVNVYLAPTGADYTDLSQWELVGWCKSGEVRLAGDEKHTIRTGRGVTLELSQKYIFSAQALETTRAQVTALEALLRRKIDILLEDLIRVQVFYLIKNFEMKLAPEFTYDFKSPRKLRIRAQRTAKHFTDLYERISFYVPPGVGDPDLYGGIHFEQGALL